jgi:intein/homing endonuclease
MTDDYIAGLLDADGYIALLRQAKNEHKRPVLGFTNTNRELIDEVISYFSRHGYKPTVSRKAPLKDNHKESWDVKLVGKNAMAFIEIWFLRSYHTKKRERMRLILTRWIVRGNGKYTPHELELKAQFEQDFLAL